MKVAYSWRNPGLRGAGTAAPLLVLATLLLPMPLPVLAQTPAATATQSPATTSPLAPAAPAEAASAAGGAPRPAAQQGANAITQYAVQQGILQCAARINQVTNYLGAGPETGTLLMAPATPTDQRLFGVAQEVQDPQAGSAYVSAAFAPNQANGCGASYDAVIYWPRACEAVASQQFSSLKKSGALKQAITVLEVSPASRVFLMPAGSGCISIKKEIVL